ncbi:hypothetical protein [uncultured Draconibacterium sp.]|uniref:hypothetical protein n=1 Tax=uncultured Draconibacterium sp. TaxID=1573823 RepID=UPI0032180F1B
MTMEKHSTRRNFLKNSAFATVGISLLSSTILKAGNNTETNFDLSVPDLRTGFFHENYIAVSGKVYDKQNLLPKANAVLHVLSGNSSNPIASINVDDEGRYRFVCDFPKKEFGKSARLYLKLSTPESFYTTELILTEFGAHITDKHWELNQSLGDRIFPKKQSKEDVSEISFNLSI